MWYIYFLRSQSNPKKTYIGITQDVDRRVAKHNAGDSPHTARFIPWELMGSLAVPTKRKAIDLERYFKQGSGHAWLHKHLW